MTVIAPPAPDPGRAAAPASAAAQGGRRALLRVLAIDGGGIRGIIPATVLAAVEARTGRPIAQDFDILAGTSTGGILALGLACPAAEAPTRPRFTAQDLCAFYHREGPAIFDMNMLQRARSRFADRLQGRESWRRLLETGSEVANRLLFSLRGPRYAAQPIEAVLARNFGDVALSQALTRVVIPAYDLAAMRAVFLTHGGGQPTTGEGAAADFWMRDCARATSAAPTFFAPIRVRPIPGTGPAGAPAVDYVLADGGLHSNTPALAGLTEAMTLAGRDCDVLVVSLGTGDLSSDLGAARPASRGARPDDPESARWGLLDWVNPARNMPLMAMAMNGQADAISQTLETLLGPERFVRFDKRLDSAAASDRPSAAIDDASPDNLARLQRFADSLVAEQAPALERLVALLDQAQATPRATLWPPAAAGGSGPGGGRTRSLGELTAGGAAVPAPASSPASPIVPLDDPAGGDPAGVDPAGGDPALGDRRPGDDAAGAAVPALPIAASSCSSASSSPGGRQ